MAKREDKRFILSKTELEEIMTRSSKMGAADALKAIGLDDHNAHIDIRNLRELLRSFRMAKSHAFGAFIKWLVVGLMVLLTAGFLSIISK
ncbi:MAG: hypothetical protein ACI9TO_000239 [Rickettsiales bacterium]|jgi:hypothetical protein